MGLRTLALKGGDIASLLALEGQAFYASDAAQGDFVTGVTSFATTTPTFLLRVPSGTTAIPLGVSLAQASTVAGAAISVILEFDNAERFSAGGTTETILSARTIGPSSSSNATAACTVLSNPTATDAYGIRVDGVVLGPDVSSAEGAVNQYLWTPSGGYSFLVGPAAMLVYTFAGTTAPTWLWTLKWAEVLTVNL